MSPTHGIHPDTSSSYEWEEELGDQPWSVRVADLNGDGNPDIVCTYLPDMVAIFLGNGDGTFRAGQQYQVKAFAHISAVSVAPGTTAPLGSTTVPPTDV